MDVELLTILFFPNYTAEKIKIVFEYGRTFSTQENRRKILSASKLRLPRACFNLLYIQVFKHIFWALNALDACCFPIRLFLVLFGVFKSDLTKFPLPLCILNYIKFYIINNSIFKYINTFSKTLVFIRLLPLLIIFRKIFSEFHFYV